MRLLKLFVLCILAIPLAAAPTIAAVSPASGPTTGGTTVTITGTGFSAALQPEVLFGDGLVPATVVSSTTLTVTTPPYLPGTYDVAVHQSDGRAVLPDSFTYLGPPPESEFERILVPLLIPPAAGAFGAVFQTELTVGAKEPSRLVTVKGLRLTCMHIPCPFDGVDTVELHGNDADIRSDAVRYDGTPGRFLYVRKFYFPNLYGHLRVRDVTRAAMNLGTELPLVRAREFTTDPIVLPNEHAGADYRTTLRIYAPEETAVVVKVTDHHGDETEHVVELIPGGSTIYDPAYGYFADFPAEGWSKVTIAPVEVQVLPIQPPVPFWAFVSMTNNETQMITTITPQP